MNKQDPRVAVLMATYNGENWIDVQIESIINQKNVKTDLFISDDFSTDSTISIIKNFQNKYQNRIFILPNIKRQEKSASLNFFSLISHFESKAYDYVSFSDQDDIWKKKKLRRGIDLVTEKKAAAYSSNVSIIGEKNSYFYLKKSIYQKKYDYLFESAGPGSTYILTYSTFVKFKNFLLNQKELSKIWFHDWLIYAYYRNHQMKWIIDFKSGLFYRQHNDNVFGAPTLSIEASLKRLKLIRSGFYRSKIINLVDTLGIENRISNCLKRFNFTDRIYLALNVYQLRRKIFDQIVLFFLLFIIKKN